MSSELPPDPASSAPHETTDALLKFTYAEVLDATKHQDDKINRLLTAIAFLTAAALTLGNLDSAAGLHTRFVVEPHIHPPLALLVLGAFLIGVVAAVVMLITSMTTPLRYPGGTKPDMPAIRYADAEVKASPFYFTEIAGTSPQQWYAKWERPAPDLALERRDALIRETHNLAVRTDFKYQQTKEAVAVLAFALLSLALSIVLVIRGIIAAQSRAGAAAVGPAAPVQIGLSARVLLALTLGGYVALQLFAISRPRRQTVVERATFGPLAGVRIFLRTVSPIVVAAVPATLMAVPFSRTAVWDVVSVGLPVVAAAVFIAGLPWVWKDEQRQSRDAQRRAFGNLVSQPPADTEADLTKQRRELNRRLVNLSVIAGAIALGYLLVGVVSLTTKHYWLQLAAGYGSGLVLLLATLIQSARARTAQVRKWLRPAG